MSTGSCPIRASNHCLIKCKEKPPMIKKLEIRHKLMFLGLVFTVPLLIVTGMLVHEKNSELKFIDKERAGVGYLQPLCDILFNLEDYQASLRDVSAGKVEKDFLEKRAQVDQDFTSLSPVDRRFG